MFRARADDLFRFTVDGNILMDSISSGGEVSTSILEGQLRMVEVGEVVCSVRKVRFEVRRTTYIATIQDPTPKRLHTYRKEQSSWV